MLKVKRLDNMDIVVNDFPKMVAFYKDVLGLALHPHGYEPEKGWAMFMCGDVDLVLLSVPTADRPGRRKTSNYNADPAGVHSFAMHVENIDEAIAALDKAGVEWAGPTNIYGAGSFLDEVPKGEYPGMWYRFRSFYDPEGNIMHVCEVHEPKGFDRSKLGRR